MNSRQRKAALLRYLHGKEIPCFPLYLEPSMTNLSSFSWVRGQVFGAEVFGDFAILDQGGAFSVVRISTKDFMASCPDFSRAFRFLRKQWAK